MLNIPNKTDYINPASVNSLRELFQARVELSANKIAYEYFSSDEQCWKKISWRSCETLIQLWASALKKEGFNKGDRVAILIKNSLEWVVFEQASFACGLTIVPLFTDDRAENIAYIINNANVKCILISGDTHWDRLYPLTHKLNSVKRILSIEEITDNKHDERLLSVEHWLKDSQPQSISADIKSNDLASIVYTSGTTGKSKGVMLSHDNIMQNAWSGVHSIDVYPYDHFLSFLPMSHMLERTIGYYLPMLSGAKVSFSRSITELAEDLITQNPTVIISVPRIFERVYLKIEQTLEKKPSIVKWLFNYAIKTSWEHYKFVQHKRYWKPSFLLLPLFDSVFFKKIREKFGKDFRFAISGGAALEYHVAQLFISIGIIIAQGYGLTEYSPVISVNRLDDNDPKSVGKPLPGVEISIGDENELLVKGKSTMSGYWNDEEATKQILDNEGWLHTGDQVNIIDNKIYITGRLKDILVLSNGEKVPPCEIEQAILQDPLFENVIIIGDARPYLSALVTLNADVMNGASSQSEDLIEHANNMMSDFPGYAKIHSIRVCKDSWTIDNGLLTPTMKPRRKFIIARNQDLINEMYEGH